jgi:hypothetical protein
VLYKRYLSGRGTSLGGRRLLIESRERYHRRRERYQLRICQTADEVGNEDTYVMREQFQDCDQTSLNQGMNNIR